MRNRLTFPAVSGRAAWLGSMLLIGFVLTLGCGGSDTAPDAGAPSESGADDGGAAPTSEDGGADDTDAAAATDESGDDLAEPAASETPDESMAAVDEPAESPTPEASAPEANAAPKEQAAEKGKTQPQPATAAKEAAEPAASLPDDVVDWQDRDYLTAKRRRDPKFLDAVAYLGENNAGDAQAAQLLVELLTLPEDPEPEPKPEPKVEKKPEKKDPMGYDDYPDDGYEEEYQDESYEEDYDEMYPGDYDDGYGSGQRRKAEKTPLAANYISLTGAIVRALGANGTKEARTVLEQLLAGRIGVGNDRAAVGAVLRTLIDYPSTENDVLLYRAMTSPETYRQSAEKVTAALKMAFGVAAPEATEDAAAGSAKKDEPDAESLVAAALANTVTAEDLRDTTLPLAEEAASMKLRYGLAKYLLGPTPSKEIGPRLQELVTATNPLNVEAQAFLYGQSKTPVEMRDSFERYFTAYASCSLGRMLGISTEEDAELDAPVMSGGINSAAPTESEGWSGFGDEPTQPKRSGSGSSNEDEYEMQQEAYEEYEEEYDDSGYEEETMSPEGYEEGYYDDGSGSGGGSQAKPPKGPGEPDKLSIQKFNEVAAGDPNIPYKVARHLWAAHSESLCATVARKMNGLASLEEGAQLVMLAGAIPTDAMRRQLYKTLEAHWQDGPEAFASASAYAEDGGSDPGFLVVIKSLPRQEPPARQRKELTAEQQAKINWMFTVLGTVEGFCERFQLAADNEMMNTAEVLESLPFKVRSPETVTHAYALDWSQRVGGRLTGAPVDPMRVYYVRVEENELFSKVKGAYTRAVSSGAERVVENGLWIDSLRPGPEPGRKTSIDVLIERLEPNQERPRGTPEPIVVQILYVEINDPAPATAKTAAK